MTPKQSEVLRYIAEYAALHGYSPTLQEIGDHLRITKVTALSHLRQLERARHIRRGRYQQRGIRILTPPRRIPVVGKIADRRLVEAASHSGDLDILGFLREGREYFALEVRGGSMEAEHIRDGDYVIVERRAPQGGETGLEVLATGEVVLGKVGRETAEAAPSAVRGVLVGLFRRM